MTTSIFQTKSRRAFTLVELLVTISIISILLGLLISTVRAVRRFSRQTITRGELKNIEAAWKQFYAHYQYWPNAESIAGVSRTDTGGDAQYELLAPLARMLEGADVENIEDPSGLITTYNADRIAFLELTRFNRDGDPVNAWSRAHELVVPGKEKSNTYVVIFDTNGDNQILVELPGEPSTNLFRSVAVWTENPEYVENEADADGPPPFFGSWME
jgi:prepilin-type N-terminal cleavage/methylation domain-containing protein